MGGRLGQVTQRQEARKRRHQGQPRHWYGIFSKDHTISKLTDLAKAQKYKQYNQVRDILSGKVSPPTDRQPRKRKPDAPPAQTPTKRTRHFETPSKDRTINHDDNFMSPAVSRKLFSPVSVTSLGPTPQRDGRVLGLFDLLVEKELGTPTKNGSPTKRAAQRRIDATPSKRSTLDDETTARLGRTPMSTSKRQALDMFMTPRKDRGKNPDAVTPSSVSKLQFDTPAFLKRNSLPVLDEIGDFDAPAPLRLPRKPMVRGLSEIVASLRKVEEEALDELEDDLEALREIENEGMGGPGPKPAQSKHTDAVLVEDSQVKHLPLGGFDDEGMYDSPDEEVVGRDGKLLRVFKKKGQKRTTRKVNMKPTRTKRPTNMEQPQNSDDEDEENRIPETQQDGADMGPESDFEAAKSKPKKKPTRKAEGTVKKAVRKVNELAHANFQRLKLKNNGAKGGPGFNSRFRRRR